MKKYMMNLNAINAMRKDLMDFLIHEVGIDYSTSLCVPVVDLTTGFIYSSLGLDKTTLVPEYQSTMNRVVKSIETGTGFKPMQKKSKYGKMIPIDGFGSNVTGHYFMDVGSMELSVLRGLWGGWISRERQMFNITTHEMNMAKKYLKINKELDEILADIKSMI